MTSILKIILFCSLSVLLEVESRHQHLVRRSDENEEASTDMRIGHGRGIIGDFFTNLRDSSHQQKYLENIPLNIYPEEQLTQQVPSNQIAGTQTQSRPSILGGLLTNMFNSRENDVPSQGRPSIIGGILSNLRDNDGTEQNPNQGRPSIIGGILSNLRDNNGTEQNPNQGRPSIIGGILSNLRDNNGTEQNPNQGRPSIIGGILSNLRDNNGTEQNSNQGRPSIIGGLLSNMLTSREKLQVDTYYNKAWLDYAMQKCGRIDPSSLTAILPTKNNGLRKPKMYYFQNDTSRGLPWQQAQQWCTSMGMALLTVNDEYENIIIIDRLKQIMAGNIPSTITPPGVGNVPPASIDTNPNAFWIGLNSLNQGNSPVWVGDGTSIFTDFYSLEPSPSRYCGTYNQVTTVDNIHMDAVDCLNTPVQNLRYICEVSDECVALFMSRFPTSYFQNHHHEQNAGTQGK